MITTTREKRDESCNQGTLLSKHFLDRVESINEKPSAVTEGQIREKPDSGESEDWTLDNPILADTPNLYKQFGASMSENFIKLIRSPLTDELQRTDPKLFLLFSWMARKAQRTNDENFFDLDPNEVMIARDNASDCGLTPKELRCAIERGIEKGYFIVTFSPKQKMGSQKQEDSKRQKRAIKRAIKCKVLKLLNRDIFDINPEDEGHQKGNGRAMKGPSKGHIQEREEREERYIKESSSSSGGVEENENQKRRRIFSKEDCKKEMLACGWKDEEFEEGWRRYKIQPEGKVKKFHGWFISVLESVRMDFQKKNEMDLEKKIILKKIEENSKIAAEKQKLSIEKKEKEEVEEKNKIREINEKILKEFLSKYPDKVFFKKKMFQFVTREIGMNAWFSIEEPIQPFFLGLVEESIKADCEREKKHQNLNS